MVKSIGRTFAKLSVCAMFFQSMSTQAIMMRHDVEPDAYLLDALDYQATVHIRGCTATLIAPRWLLTAAHCVEAELSHYQSGQMLDLMGEQMTIANHYIHPQWGKQDRLRYDIALIELNEPSHNLLPARLYEQKEELNQIFKLAGYGLTGNGQIGVYDQCFPCRLRGADNKAIRVDDYLLGFRFDNPNAGNSLPLEGVSAPGDSGGPAYIQTDEGRFVAGVSAFGDLGYGDSDHFTRVSSHLNWLSEIMSTDYPGSYDGPLYSETNDTQPDPAPPSSNTGNVNTNTDSGDGGGSFGWVWLLLGGLLVKRRS